ncbi:MAG: chalcone isomerase family protein [Desulfobacteraceae bacterium]
MFKNLGVSLFILLFVLSPFVCAEELAGVDFPDTKVVEGKKLTLNGTALRKAFVFVKVFAGGLYLEHPTQDPGEIIESEQVKHFYLYYLTNKATAEKIQNGFIEEMEKTNPPELVDAHRAQIEQYVSWLDEDMKVGSVSESVYVPGKGLTLKINGKVKGTIKDEGFAQMYYTYSLGEKADPDLKKGYLGL